MIYGVMKDYPAKMLSRSLSFHPALSRLFLTPTLADFAALSKLRAICLIIAILAAELLLRCRSSSKAQSSTQCKLFSISQHE